MTDLERSVHAQVSHMDTHHQGAEMTRINPTKIEAAKEWAPMSDMTPQEARELLDDWQAGGMVDWDSSRAALETLAAEQIEYGMEAHRVGGWENVIDDPWGLFFTNDIDEAKAAVSELTRRYRKEYRIVARRVSEPWEVKE